MSERADRLFDVHARTTTRSAHDDLVDVDYRVGDHLQSAVEYLKIGPVGMMFLPGEMSGELVNGLPASFRTAPEQFYAEPRGTHAFGDALTTPGFVKQRMHDTYEWTISLGGDELGYVMPITNFRAKCVLDEIRARRMRLAVRVR